MIDKIKLLWKQVTCKHDFKNGECTYHGCRKMTCDKCGKKKWKHPNCHPTKGTRQGEW